MQQHDPGNPLGRITPQASSYAPELLYPIARVQGREGLPAQLCGAMRGEDIWQLWELSWLAVGGMPQVAVGRLRVPASSPNLVESKSLKLYLNSLNMMEFADEASLTATIVADVSAVVGASVTLELLSMQDPTLQVAGLPGQCIDALQPGTFAAAPDRALLQVGEGVSEQVLHSHLLRSLCPVTAQPDWASVIVSMDGAAVTAESLLAYLLSFRQHQDFHEQCVERMYCDLFSVCQPTRLSVQALYSRRGGLDINPWRASDSTPAPLLRSGRQ